MRRLALALAFAWASVAAAQEPDPIQVQVHGLLGDPAMHQDSYAYVVTTVANSSRRDRSGVLELDLGTYDARFSRHLAPLQVPAGQRREVTMLVRLDARTTELRAAFRSDGRVTRGALTIAYGAGAPAIVVMSDAPRLASALTDLDVTEQAQYGPREVRVPIGAVSFDVASGDPRVPPDALGWSAVRVLFADAAIFARMAGPERRAILDWVAAGGRLAIVPRTHLDFVDPQLTALAGSMSAELEAPVGSSLFHRPTLLAPATRRFAVQCGEEQVREEFGCSRSVGYGRVYVLDYDASAPDALATGAPRELARALYATMDRIPPALAYGRGRDELANYGYDGTAFGPLRVALDPNEGFRPALALVALVLFLYVLVVGPINFRAVQRRNRPMLALLTTPLAALGCMLVLLTVGYVGKGVRMRYRRVEVIDAVEGQTRLPSRRYTGLFSTRPGSFDLAGPREGAVHRIQPSADVGPEHRYEEGRTTLRDFRAGLWETTFLREDQIVELGGAITFIRDGRRLAAVQNGTRETLHDAVVVHGTSRYVVGDVAPGASAPIPRTATYSALSFAGFGEEEAAYLRGIDSVMLGPPLMPHDVPVLHARLAERSERLGPFTAERDLRVLRIAPRLRAHRVIPAAPPTGGSSRHVIPPAPIDAGAPEMSFPDDAGTDAGGGA